MKYVYIPDAMKMDGLRLVLTQGVPGPWGEAAKGLFLINGGGAVALLAFLQAVWTDATALVPWVVFGLVPLAAGLVLAAVANYVRAESALKWEGWFSLRDKAQRE